MGADYQKEGEVRNGEALQRLDLICGSTAPSNSIADLVSSFIRGKFKGNVVHFAKHAGVNRNFIIDIQAGEYRKTREGHKLAHEDPRYALLAKALGFEGEDVTVFIELISGYQSSTIRIGVGSFGHLGAEINNTIVIFRADILRACPDIDAVRLEKAIDKFRENLLQVLVNGK